MGPKRRKPRGRQGVITLGAKPAFHELQLPDEKAALELTILNGALRTARLQNAEDPYRLTKNPEQNKENHFDFTLTTASGRAYLDLMEAAPLSEFGGDYTKVPQIREVGTFAEMIYKSILKKNAKYGIWATPVHLLLYSTDWKLSLPPSVLTLLGHWLLTKPHGFASVNYFLPAGVMRPIWAELFPSKDEELLAGIDETEVVSRQFACIDMSTIRKDRDGKTVTDPFRFDATNFEMARISTTGHVEWGRFPIKPDKTNGNEVPGV